MTEARTTHKRHLRGIVVSDKAAKTITVELTRRFQHRKYGKFVQKKTRVHAHDESRAAHVGDTVDIIECRPMSRLKRWRLVEVVLPPCRRPPVRRRRRRVRRQQRRQRELLQ